MFIYPLIKIVIFGLKVEVVICVDDWCLCCVRTYASYYIGQFKLDIVNNIAKNINSNIS